MDAYFWGNLIGRLVTSYIITWLILWLFARFDAKKALRNSRRWYGITLLLIIYLAGLLVWAQRLTQS